MLRYWRKVIQIKAVDSPNVRLAMDEIAQGRQPSHTELVPGVKSYRDYVKHRNTWDPIMQSIGLDAEFYRGQEVMLFPPEWLDEAAGQARNLPSDMKGTYMGVDPAEGGDSSCWAIINDRGLCELVSKKTPDTTIIVDTTRQLINRHGLRHANVFFDRGGGGKQHADRMRKEGYRVKTVAFGEAASPVRQRGMKTFDTRSEEDERRYIYRNRRSEMYGMIREILDPYNEHKWGLRDWGEPYAELRRQLTPLPLLFDEEGRMELPPKRKRDADMRNNRQQNRTTLIDLIGHSPDEADALALAVYGMRKKLSRPRAGAI